MTLPEGIGLGPGDEQTINPAIENESNGSIYEFMLLSYDPSVYSFELDDSCGWVTVPGVDNLYAYAQGNTMTAVDKGEGPELLGTMTVIADGAEYSDLVDDDMLITVDAYGIMSSVSRSAVGEAWEDYENGGKPEG